uniref:Transposase n=1 Tax=Heterorhabditis bacteriophora TaxID=37862 RepID=A0A1I7WF06_HETBA
MKPHLKQKKYNTIHSNETNVLTSNSLDGLNTTIKLMVNNEVLSRQEQMVVFSTTKVCKKPKFTTSLF